MTFWYVHMKDASDRQVIAHDTRNIQNSTLKDSPVGSMDHKKPV